MGKEDANNEGRRMKISRYRELSGAQATSQPGSYGRVLLNRLGLTSKRALDLAEALALARVQETYYARLTAKTRFTAALVRQMHQDWLSDIYEWAGEYRQVELEKDGFRWPPAERVADNMLNFERGILRQHTPCNPPALDEVTKSIAIVHAELLLIHPFRDGNGRLARWLADIMAAQAGYPAPAYGFSGRGSKKRRADYLLAVQQGYVENYLPLARFFAEAILRRREVEG
jgi:cell filamentation protein